VNGAPVAFNRWLGTIDLGTRSGDVTVAATVTR
jgi:hypothetical protein